MHLRVIFVVVLVFVWPSLASAQARLTGADLLGTVSDPSGALVPGCAITVTNLETSLSRTSSTDQSGHYIVPALPPGTYAVQVVIAGFQTQIRDRVVLALGQSARVDFRLALAIGEESVVVEASAAVVAANATQLSTVINQRQIDTLPSNGRNFIGFAVIAPGVTGDRTPMQGATATTGLSFTGQRGRANNIMVDGLDNNDPFVGSVRATFSQDAIREFQVLVNSYSAEFGKASGGVVNIVTKSGTNAFHGNSFLYFRDRALNARGYFDKFDALGNRVSLEKPPFGQKQWGGTLGGPLRRNRTFFFASFERNSVNDSRRVTIDPTAAALLNASGFPIELGNVPLRVTNTELFGKIDHQWTPSRTLVVRGNYGDISREGIDEFGGTVARSRGTVLLRTDWAVSVAQTDVLSNRWISELRGQFAREDQQVNALDPRCGGPCIGVDQGGPALEITGFAAVGRNRISPQVRLNRRIQLSETVSRVAGRHHVKVGVDFNDVMAPTGGNLLPVAFGGRFIFSAIPALGVTSALDGLQKGLPANYVKGYGNPHYPDERFRDLAVFAQDEWTLGRIVFKPGVRYQRQFWQEATYRVGDLGGTSYTYSVDDDINNVAPRLGVSFDPTGTRKTFLHASYGMFYDNVNFGAQNIGRILDNPEGAVRLLGLPASLASVAWKAPGSSLTEEQAIALLGGTFVGTTLSSAPNMKNGFTHQLSVGVDRELAGDLALRVDGLYVRGFNQVGTLEYNPLLPAILGPGRRPNDAPCTTNPAAACVNGGIPGSSGATLEFVPFGQSWYRGLVVALSRRYSRRHQFLLSYTLSKAEDTSTDYPANFIAQNSGRGRNPADREGLPLGFDTESDRGPATHDQRHRFVFSGLYQLPLDVQVSGIVTAASGRPFTPLAGGDLNGDGNGGQIPTDRARRDPASEATSVGRNSETTAAQMNVDLRVSRRFRLRGGTAVEVLLDAFNLFNRTNFVEDTNQSSFVVFGTGAFPANPLPAYGRYTLTLPPRQLQLALRLGF